MTAPLARKIPQPSDRIRSGAVVMEVLLIWGLFFLVAGSPAPAVNEAHYLAKAKHFWDVEWCRGDIFLESKNAHLAFNWTFGWITRFVSLTTTAWIGRLLVWLLLACGWQRLSAFVLPGRYWSVLSAAAVLSLIEYSHLAGEWLVGGIEAKGFSFVCVFFALGSLVRGGFRSMWVLLGAATFFHVLVGGWSMVAAALSWCLAGSTRPPFRITVLWMAIATLIALPSLWSAIELSREVDSETVRRANRIYVYERLGHHVAPANVLPATFVQLDQGGGGRPGYYLMLPSTFVLRHGALLLIWAGLLLVPSGQLPEQQRGLQHFVAGTVLIAAIGSVCSVIALWDQDLGASLLRYYWFRLTDVMVPVGVVVRVLACIQTWRVARPVRGGWCLAGVLLLVISGLGNKVAESISDPRPGADRQSLPLPPMELPTSVDADSQSAVQRRAKIYADWRRVCRWVALNTPDDCGVLTPFAQQTFKWYAGRREVVNYKDVPQDASSLVEWWRRLNVVYPPTVRRSGLGAFTDRKLVSLAREYDAQYLILDRTRFRRATALPRLYPDKVDDETSYCVYWIPPPDSKR